MNFLLGDETVPVIQGTLAPTAPILQGSLTGPIIYGVLSGDSKHDLKLVGDNISLTAGLDQRIDCALRTFLNEFWLDPSIGMPYFSEFLKKNPDITVCKQAFATVIQGVPGVQEITRLVVNFSNNSRTFTVSFDVRGTDAIPVSSTSEVQV